jgi:hypothetical protein
MCNLCKILTVLLCVNALMAAERPWTQINDPTASEVQARFAQPPAENGMTLWWGWDGAVTEEVITRDLDRIKGMGFTCVMIEAGNRMTARYLSPEWFKLVRFAVDQAKARDMRVWVEDEGKYPSGFVGGKFTEERPDLRMQGLALRENIDVGSGQTVERTITPETICAVAYDLNDNSNKVVDIASGQLKWTAPAAGRWRVCIVEHQFKTGATRSVNNPNVGAKDATHSLCDYLNPEATRQIIAWTHAEYKKALGDEFGRTFMGFMGDEPDYYGVMPWTPKMLEEFQSRKGYDVRPYLAWFFSNTLPDEVRRVKADYWDVWSDLFAQNYFKVLADWCAANNVEYIVHLNNEDRNTAFVRGGGDFFKNMRSVGIPGIDAIWSQIWMDHEADYPKMASSAAHLFGRPHAFTESFAAFTNRPDVPQAKWVMDYQLVRGINAIQIMFMPASSGRAGAPASGTSPVPPQRRGSFFTSPEFVPVAAYVRRASYLLSQGRPAAQIGLYVPTTSLWLGDNKADESNLSIAQKLLEQQRDFDWIDEQALSSVLKLEGGELKNLSGQGYKTVIIPSVATISKSALDRLKAFAAAGGKVIFLGREPALAVEKTFRDAKPPADLSWAGREPSGEFTEAVMKALPAADVAFDKPCAAIKCLHRRWRDADLYFFFNESAEPHACNVTLVGGGQAYVWNAATGTVESVPARSERSGSISMELALASHETRFIVLKQTEL